MKKRRDEVFLLDCRSGRRGKVPLCARSAVHLAEVVGIFLLFMFGVGPSAPSAEEKEKSSAELVRMGDEAFEVGRYSAAVEFYRSALKQDEGNFTARLKLIELLARLAGREDEARREMDAALGMESLNPEQIGLIAEICSANGFPDRARSAYERLLKLEPSDLPSLGKLVELVLSDNDVDRARTEIQRYRDSASSTIEGLELIAQKCMSHSQYALARLAYDGVLQKDEKNLSALLGISESLTMLGEFPEAAKRLRWAGECYPRRPEPAIALGEILVRAGDYAAAETAFQKAQESDPKSLRAADGYAMMLFATGRYAEAQETLSDALKSDPDSPVLLVSLGRVFNYIGEYESAPKHFDKALSLEPGYPDAILGLGMSCQETGKLTLAKEHFLRLYDFWDARVNQLGSVSPRDMVDVAIACALTDNPQNALDVLEQVLKKEPVNLEALLWEARLFSERHQPVDAERELKRLLSLNPNHPEAHAEVASIYLESSRFGLAEESCQRALKTNPNLIRGLDLLSSVQILDFDYSKAEQTVKKALTINPRSLSSLSFLASCYWQEGKKDLYDEVRKKVLEINPFYSDFYLTVARACENRRCNEEAVGLLKEAIALRPDYAPAYTRVGVLLMREGEEEEAEKYLRNSYRLDSYNPQTTNFINLLEYMKRNFVSTRTEHFLIKWGKEKGAVLSFFLPEYAEEVYGQVCEEFGYEPRNPTLLEVFESHDQFSARIVGLPFVATVGASLGKVVAADCPERAAFDWKDVLRHEFVHVVNLQQSRMQIPFWFTEGLATCCEQSPLPAEWDGLVARMLYLNRVIPLKDLNSYFTRPRTLRHKQAAYAQSNLICRFLLERFGRNVISNMIEMYGKNSPTAEVTQSALSMSEGEFEREVTEYIFARAREKRVAPLFLEGDGALLSAMLRERPDDELLRVACARLLFQEAVVSPEKVRQAKLDEALQLLEKVTKVNPRARGACSTLAEIYMARKEYEKAKNAAAQAAEIDPEDFVAHGCLGLACQREGNKADAIRALEKAADLYPKSADVWYALGGLYSELKDEEALARALEGAARADRRNLETSKQLARLHLTRKDYEAAVPVLERALRYNLYDADLYKLLVDALRAKEDEASAKRYAEIGAEAAYVTAKSLMPFQKQKVIELLNLSLELNPEHEGAKGLLGQIKDSG